MTPVEKRAAQIAAAKTAVTRIHEYNDSVDSILGNHGKRPVRGDIETQFRADLHLNGFSPDQTALILSLARDANA
jgi:hypothetical protein